MTKAKTGVQKIRAHMTNLHNEDGMEAAQLILILVIVVVILIPVIMSIANRLRARGTEIEQGIDNIK